MSFSAPVGYTTVAADTMVAVHSLDGAAVISYQCQSNTDVLVVSMALTHMIAKRLKVPKLCINLVWGSMETKQVIVTFNLTPLSQAGQDRLDLALVQATRELEIDYLKKMNVYGIVSRKEMKKSRRGELIKRTLVGCQQRRFGDS